jgi:hypothetical protein
MNLSWHYVPPVIGTNDLRQDFRGGIALNSDGTLIAVNNGYVIAIRPLLGDFNGDGCRNNFDIDAFNLAMTNPAQWETDYGLPRGLNFVGVGDINNDGFVNSFDINPFVALINNYPRCVEVQAICGTGNGGGGEAAQSRGEQLDGADGEDGWAHFWEVIEALRQQFGV